MLNGKELILATKPFAKEDKAKSWFYTLSTLFLLVFFLAGTYYNFNLGLKLLCSIFSGLLIVRMFVIYHDHQHHAILNKSPLANIIFTIFGLYILAPPSIWSRSHDYHHKNNSKLSSASIGSFPIYTKKKFLAACRSEQIYYLFIRHPLTILFGYGSAFLYGMCIKSFTSCSKKHFDSIIALVIHFAYISLIFYYLGWETWLLSSFIPHFISGAMGAYLFYAQHNFPGVTFKNNVEWSYDHAALESSSYLETGRFFKWITANIGYHHVHHLNARIPFYRLPEVMEKIPELQQVKRTSLQLKDIMACFKLKVWDPDKNKMISLKEI